MATQSIYPTTKDDPPVEYPTGDGQPMAETPLHRDNVFGHLLFGISNAPVDSLIVNGRYVLREGRCVKVDEREVAAKAAARAKALWQRI